MEKNLDVHASYIQLKNYNRLFLKKSMYTDNIKI